MTTENFIERANVKHDGRYNYSCVDYKGIKNTVKIICPVHGEFLQVAEYHLNGSKCPKCSRKETVEDYIKKVSKRHQNKYIYDITTLDYIITLRCPEHGVFTVSKRGHREGVGCPKCRRGQHGVGMVLLG